MKANRNLECLLDRADDFMAYLGLGKKVNLVFVEKPGIDEYKVNDLYPPANSVLYFNICFFNNMDMEYIQLIVFHEIVHFARQGIKTISDVKNIKEDNSAFMQLIDIEADVVVTMYLEVKYNLTFEKYLSILHKGANVFRDRKIRMPKFERFIGSLLSIYTFLVFNEKKVYLPHIKMRYASLTIIDFTGKGCLIYDSIDITNDEFEELETVYQNTGTIPETEYISICQKVFEDLVFRIRCNQAA